jgi:hypothetical protein
VECIACNYNHFGNELEVISQAEIEIYAFGYIRRTNIKLKRA